MRKLSFDMVAMNGWRVRHLSSLIGAGLLLAACQTSGSDGILSNALPDGAGQTSTAAPVDGSAAPDNNQVATAAPVPGQNPNARTRLKNTRNALTDYCPAVRIRAGTESFRVIPKGKDKENGDNVRYQATITKVARECAYVGQDLQIKVGARGRVITGPAGGPGNITMPIRVAVTEGGETIYSKLHRPQETIGQGSSSAQFSFVDDQVIIPAPSRTNVRIFLGFDEGPYNTP